MLLNWRASFFNCSSLDMVFSSKRSEHSFDVVLLELLYRLLFVFGCRMAIALGDRDGAVPHELPQGHEIHSCHGHPSPVGVAEVVQPEIEPQTLTDSFVTSNDDLVG